MYISLSTLPWGGVLLAISPSSLPVPLPLSSHPPTVSRNGAFSVGRHVPNPSEALPQALNRRSIRPAWAKRFAARMASPSFTHPTLPTTRGGCWSMLNVQDMKLTTWIGISTHYGPWTQRASDSNQGYWPLRERLLLLQQVPQR
jgi:hypothetical protein